MLRRLSVLRASTAQNVGHAIVTLVAGVLHQLVLGVVQVGSGDTSGVPFIVIVVAIALIVAGVV